MQFFNRDEVAQYLRGIQPGVPGWKGTTTAQALKDMGQALLFPGDVVTGYKEPTLEGATNMAVDIMPMSAVASMATKVPAGALGANVFHGGPHRWSPEPDFPHGRPRLDKMGTGEGAQAYGPGFYAAEAPGVARTYKTPEGSYARLTGQLDPKTETAFDLIEGGASTSDVMGLMLSKYGGDISFDEVIATNVKKLEKRYPGGSFEIYKSENREEGDL